MAPRVPGPPTNATQALLTATVTFGRLTCPQKRDPIIKLGAKKKKIWAKTNSQLSRSLVNFVKQKFCNQVVKVNNGYAF